MKQGAAGLGRAAWSSVLVLGVALGKGTRGSRQERGTGCKPQGLGFCRELGGSPRKPDGASWAPGKVPPAPSGLWEVATSSSAGLVRSGEAERPCLHPACAR